ncbi:MAG TPA: fluoride efflux transporter CrcB [Sphingomicrobium sp.]|nr:fluoride efflux transporter CrcB [Sphingomicrobium sp.]
MSPALKPILLVFIGGGLGSVLRLFVFHLSRLWLPPSFPHGTLAVNVLGSFIAGLIAAMLMARGSGGNDTASLFLLTGVLGGFTTFSAFSLDAVQLWQRGTAIEAAIYVGTSVLLSIAGVVGGFAAVRALS